MLLSQQRIPHPLEISSNFSKSMTEANASMELFKTLLLQTQIQLQKVSQELDTAKKRISELEPNTKKPVPHDGQKSKD